MENNNSIEIKNLSKIYKLQSGPFSKKSKEILSNINVSIERGEVVGIVGRNGCGKSTLLKLIAKIIYPTQGTIEIKGKVAAILELGMGFHGDMSGRENIFLKGEMYGFSKNDMENLVDLIVKYAELDEYIDQPIRTYSSGMVARLAFAIMIHVVADIYLVDEILSVGDIVFANKASQHFKKLSKMGKTILLVSHSNDAILQMCTKAIWIEKGAIRSIGEPVKIISEYNHYLSNNKDIIKEQAEEGNAESQYRLAHMYRDGEMYSKNNEEYIKWLKRSAEQGYGSAQYEYANILWDGDTESQSLAIEYYKSASEQGHTDAQVKYAKINSNEQVDEDIVFLKSVYKQLAVDEDPLETFRYADLLMQTSTTRDEQLVAYDWFTKAAKLGNVEAKFRLALMRMDGQIVPRNVPLAIDYLIEIANLGHVGAIMHLADLYYHGQLVPKNDEEAFKWYLKAANLGEYRAKYQTATMLKNGQGTEINMAESRKWFNIYAKSNISTYLIWAAEICKYTNASDSVNIERLYLKSAELQNPYALTCLAQLYKEGIFVMSDNEKARMYYKSAAEIWGWNISSYYDYILHSTNCVMYLSELLDALELASKYGDAHAQFILSHMYRDGQGVEKDILKSDKLLANAASKGHRDAMAELNKRRMKNV